MLGKAGGSALSLDSDTFLVTSEENQDSPDGLDQNSDERSSLTL